MRAPTPTPRPHLGSKNALQAAILLLCLVPMGASLAGLLSGPRFLAGVDAPSTDLDSHFRYLSGIFLGLALVFLSCVPDIERKSERFRLAAALVILGGLGRLYSALTLGWPSAPHLAGLALELLVVPGLVLWQSRIART